eukprot:366281-Chlamydomonas_euryale.AAC.18
MARAWARSMQARMGVWHESGVTILSPSSGPPRVPSSCPAFVCDDIQWQDACEPSGRGPRLAPRLVGASLTMRPV